MKFAHLADCHIGGWREPELRALGIDAFKTAIDTCIEENIGFILISGDLFNNALPSIDIIKEVTSTLRKARDKDIDIYVIPGSHDFSVSGKTVLDILDKAGLVHNIYKHNEELGFTIDKTGTKITGILGKRGGLEIEDYGKINREELEKEAGFKIFMFHTALSEFKPEDKEKMISLSVKALPKNFHYYAGGHVHYVFQGSYDKGKVTFPGALFPNSFKELEDFNHGGFYIVDDKINIRRIDVKLKDVLSININADNKTPKHIEEEILKNAVNIKDKILTIRIAGCLKDGKPSDIDFNTISKKLQSAYVILKNTSKLASKEIEMEIEEKSIDVIEQDIIEEIKDDFFNEKLIMSLMKALEKEKEEGEKNIDFEKRIILDVIHALSLENDY